MEEWMRVRINKVNRNLKSCNDGNRWNTFEPKKAFHQGGVTFITPTGPARKLIKNGELTFCFLTLPQPHMLCQRNTQIKEYKLVEVLTPCSPSFGALRLLEEIFSIICCHSFWQSYYYYAEF
mmetsp:Transcript_30635/g.47675  ORF Transcript_30635/g.47675 Transcript_30635/m.47675 type:complete len:122 (+) Transcript_30635:138-503(+)